MEMINNKLVLTNEEKKRNTIYEVERNKLIPIALKHADMAYGDYTAPPTESEAERVARDAAWNLEYHRMMNNLASGMPPIIVTELEK